MCGYCKKLNDPSGCIKNLKQKDDKNTLSAKVREL